jgi:hypothetical protein
MRTWISTIARVVIAAALFATAIVGAAGARAGEPYAIALPLVVGPPASGAPTGSLPADLVGTWYSGQLLNRSYYNRDTGVWGSAGGLGQMFVFGADGGYTRVGSLQIGGGTTCTSSVDVYHTGTARIEGGQILLTPSYARTRTVTCGTTTSDTEGPYETTALPWRVGEDAQRHTRLWLTEPQGEAVYYRDGLAPQALGWWASGDGGAILLYDPTSGAWASPTGESSVWYAFQSDGTYHHGRVEAGFGDDPCRPITMTYEIGTLTGSGAELRLQPTAALRHTVSLCDPSDYLDEAPALGGQERWSWGFAADGETLNLLRVSTGFRQLTLTRVQ